MAKIAHVALWTRDVERLCAFWRRVFGAEVGELYESRNRLGFASRFLTLGEGATVEVMSGPWVADHNPSERSGYAHVALSLGSREAVDRLASEMDKEGALVGAPRLTGDGFYEAVVRDPDGNLVEVTA
jgi:lactoylglutathione lyase